MNLGLPWGKAPLALAMRRLRKQETAAMRWCRFCAGRHEEERDAARKQRANELSLIDAQIQPQGSHEAMEGTTW